MIAYHGSNTAFDKFSQYYFTDYHNARYGRGFYFSTDKNVASQYASKYLYTCDLRINRPLHVDKITIKIPVLRNIILHINDITDGDFIYNIGDPNRTRINIIIMDYIQQLQSIGSDIAIFDEFVGFDDFDLIAAAFAKFGYNYKLIGNEIVMLIADDIKILNKEMT